MPGGDSSSGKTEKPVHKTHVSRRSRFEHEALPLADHAHDFKTFDRRIGRWQRFKPTRRIYPPFQRAVKSRQFRRQT